MYQRFLKGLDLVADPTGNTAKSNHYFVANWGNDETGDGSLTNPYETQYYAWTMHGAGNIYVLYEGEYENVYINNAWIVGDGKVCINSGLLQNSNDYKTIGENLIVKGSTQIGGVYNASAGLKNCTILDIASLVTYNGYGVSYRFYNCKILNSGFDAPKVNMVTFYNCIVKNCLLRNATFQSSYIDEYCSFHNSPTVSFSIFKPLVSYVDDGNNISDLPAFNNENGGDFSLTSDSPCLKSGKDNTNIGGTSVGQAYFEGSTLMDDIMNASPLLSYSDIGEIVTTGTTERIETAVETLGEYRYLPTLDTAGFYNVTRDTIISTPSDDREVYFIRWAGKTLVNGNPNFGTWHKFLVGIEPTIDLNGVTNGEAGFEPGTAEPIPAFYFQEGFVLMKRA